MPINLLHFLNKAINVTSLVAVFMCIFFMDLIYLHSICQTNRRTIIRANQFTTSQPNQAAPVLLKKSYKTLSGPAVTALWRRRHW